MLSVLPKSSHPPGECFLQCHRRVSVSSCSSLLSFRVVLFCTEYADGAISIATKSKIESSTIDSVRGEGAKAVQKRRLQIFITRGPKFEEHRAEVPMCYSKISCLK